MQAMSKACFSFTHLFTDQIFIVHLVYARHVLYFRNMQNNDVPAFKKNVIQEGQNQ